MPSWAKAFLTFLTALVVGAIGGWLFASVRLPLPWLLGSMTACMVASLFSVPMFVPRPVRPPMVSIVAVMLGASFSADLFANAGSMLLPLIGMVVFSVACGLACTAYLRSVGGFDMPTAFFAGMPGGIIDMVLLGEERGGDRRTIALAHSSRIALLVLTLPFLVQYLEGVSLGPRVAPGGSILDTPWTDFAWLAGTAATGILLGRLLRLPAPYMMGPLLVSAAVHVAHLTDFVPSVEIVNFAQLVLGTFLGCSFAGASPRAVLKVLALSVGSTVILLVLTVVFAFLVSRVSDYGLVPLTLAYSPGGLAEMSLIALALQIEVAFVVLHHVARVFLVVFGAAFFFRIVGGRGAANSPGPGATK